MILFVILFIFFFDLIFCDVTPGIATAVFAICESSIVIYYVLIRGDRVNSDGVPYRDLIELSNLEVWDFQDNSFRLWVWSCAQFERDEYTYSIMMMYASMEDTLKMLACRPFNLYLDFLVTKPFWSFLAIASTSWNPTLKTTTVDKSKSYRHAVKWSRLVGLNLAVSLPFSRSQTSYYRPRSRVTLSVRDKAITQVIDQLSS